MMLDRQTDEGHCPFNSSMSDGLEEHMALGRLVPIGMTFAIFYFCYFHLFLSYLTTLVTESVFTH